jgi:hypothetical protein
MLTPAPSGDELETALRELLRRSLFSGEEHLSVQVIGPTLTPVYILTLGVEVAKALPDLLEPIVGTRTHPSPTEWVLFRPDVEAILKTAQG